MTTKLFPPLETNQFKNSFVDTLVGDRSHDMQSRFVPGVCYSLVAPTPTRVPRLIAWSKDLSDLLQISEVRNDEEATVKILSGNLVLPSMQPYAARYGGHQFGNWAGQLGDGRAMSLGEITDKNGVSQELQLKGAGRTPYSRHADGRAVLRSSIREFLCSEAMFHLGIPTTRALSIVATGDEVLRDMFYDGHAKMEPGAVVCRVAPSFVRFGNFELFHAEQETSNLEGIINYCKQRVFPGQKISTAEWFKDICLKTAQLMSRWQAVGFVHGVMNTDNMSILGLTIDYGPYGWLERFDPDWTPNTTDFASRRYTFSQQPGVALWNLSCLADALSTIVSPRELQTSLEEYQGRYLTEFFRSQRSKLGLSEDHLEPEDRSMIEALYQNLETSNIDFTVFYRTLSQKIEQVIMSDDRAVFIDIIAESSYDDRGSPVGEDFLSWFEKYRAKLRENSSPMAKTQTSMLAVNPSFVLRNHLAFSAIQKAELGDYTEVHQLLNRLKTPFVDDTAGEHWCGKSPDWAFSSPGCSTLSCSS